MNRFALAQPATFAAASRLLLDKRFNLPQLKAGGLDVLDHIKEGLREPDLLVNIKRLRAGPEPIREDSGLIHIEANTTLAQIAASPLIQSKFPALANAAGSAATPQVRNIATLAGNLLQRPRCWYYRNDQFHCLKKGGGTCFSVEGENKFHAIFGPGPCHIVHPSNLAPPLMIADATVHLVGSDRPSLAVADLFHMPAQDLQSENTLKPGEVVTHVTLSPRPTSGFAVVKEKQSFDWPLAFAVASLELNASKIARARICAGAVAPIPWALPAVEKALVGVNLDDDQALRKAAALSVEGATPMTQNAYKLTLLQVVVRRAVLHAAGRKV